MVGLCGLPRSALLNVPIQTRKIGVLGEEPERDQPPESFAAGVDMILADVLELARKQPGPIARHAHAIVLLLQYPRDPTSGEMQA